MTRAPIRFRSARPGDAEAIHALEQRLFSSDLMSLRSIKRFISAAGARVVVGCDGTEIVAVMVLLLREPPRAARLFSLGVAASHRGRGIAMRMVKQAKASARKHGAPVLRLEVKQRNHRARRLYEAQGFRVISELPDYYSDGADGLKMAVRFAPLTGR